MINYPGHYSAILIDNEYPKHPLQLDVMMQIRRPDGNVVHCRIERDLSEILYTRSKEVAVRQFANHMAHKLLDGIREDVEKRLEEMIWERIKDQRLP